MTSHTKFLLQLAIGKTEWALGSLLWRTATYGATDQRDKLFALVDLALRRKGVEVASLPTAMAPNYRKSIVDVVRDFTRYVVENSPTLLVFFPS
jgi:hypothetical protein